MEFFTDIEVKTIIGCVNTFTVELDNLLGGSFEEFSTLDNFNRAGSSEAYWHALYLYTKLAASF